jgi:disulfide bond formation protein DsbB
MSQRLAYSLSFLTICVILGTGVYLEYFQGIMPCPLCTLQRICFATLGILFLAGIIFSYKRSASIVINFMSLIFSGMGSVLAARQIWIQYYPSPDNSECGVSLNYMLNALPIQDVAAKIFSGSTECTQRGWEFLKLNIPEWSLIFFIAFIIASVFYLIK